jgi:hypothetical protein
MTKYKLSLCVTGVTNQVKLILSSFKAAQLMKVSI